MLGPVDPRPSQSERREQRAAVSKQELFCSFMLCNRSLQLIPISLSLFLQTALSSFFQEANIPSHHQMVSVFISERRKKSSAAVFSILSLSSGNIASERIMRGWTSWRPQMLLKSLKYTYVSQGFLETVRLVFHAQFPASLWLRWNLTSYQGNFWMSWFRSFSKWSTRKEVWSCLYLHWIDLSFFYE